MAIAALATLVAAPAAAQQRDGEPDGSDVVVMADAPATERELEGVRTGFRTTGYAPELQNLDAFHAKGAARCAVTHAGPNAALLHAVLEGRFNTIAHDRKMDQFITVTRACGAGGHATFNRTSLLNVATSDVDQRRFYLYRGALFVQVLKTYAPDLKLSVEAIRSPGVGARFLAHERERNELRTPADALYFKVASCFVESEPRLALRAVYSDKAATTIDAAARIAARARYCVGGSKRVAFDHHEMRGYLADAVYRWALAVRDVPSLLPDAVAVAD